MPSHLSSHSLTAMKFISTSWTNDIAGAFFVRCRKRNLWLGMLGTHRDLNVAIHCRRSAEKVTATWEYIED